MSIDLSIGVCRQKSALNNSQRQMSTPKGTNNSLIRADKCRTLPKMAENPGKPPQIPHFGRWLKRQIEAIPAEQKQFADSAKIAFGTLRIWIGKPRPEIRGANLVRLARALKMSREDLEAVLDSVCESAAPEGRVVPVLNRPGGEVRLPNAIPIINKISASHWAENTNLDYVAPMADSYLTIDDVNAFALVCDGNCMEPDWHDGDVVIFSPMDIARRGVRDGDDVGVQLSGEANGENTFKRAFNDPENPAYLVLRCTHPDMHEELRVRWDHIIRIGRAVGSFRRARSKS
jgi:hypothetical protein